MSHMENSLIYVFLNFVIYISIQSHTFRRQDHFRFLLYQPPKEKLFYLLNAQFELFDQSTTHPI